MNGVEGGGRIFRSQLKEKHTSDAVWHHSRTLGAVDYWIRGGAGDGGGPGYIG